MAAVVLPSWVTDVLQMITLRLRSVMLPSETAVNAEWKEWVCGPLPPSHHQKPVLGRHCPQLLFVIPDLIQPFYTKKSGEYLVNVTTLFLISLHCFPGWWWRWVSPLHLLLILCRFKLEILSFDFSNFFSL